MGMTITRIRILESQQTGIAKKVYGAVPINEPWPSKAIVSELTRQGSVRDFSIIEGCLNTLKEIGLVREPMPGHFQRAKPKVEKEESMPTKPLNPVLPLGTSMPKPADPFGQLMAIGTKLRGLSQMFIELACEIDDAALAIEEKSSNVTEELANLRKLKEVLKSLG